MITVEHIAKEIKADVLCGHALLQQEVKSGFVGDLLSIVMGKAKEGCAWVTIQSHLNIIAVGVLISASCIIVTEGFEVEEKALNKAIEEEIPILCTGLSSYEVVSLLSGLGIN